MTQYRRPDSWLKSPGLPTAYCEPDAGCSLLAILLARADGPTAGWQLARNNCCSIRIAGKTPGVHVRVQPLLAGRRAVQPKFAALSDLTGSFSGWSYKKRVKVAVGSSIADQGVDSDDVCDIDSEDCKPDLGYYVVDPEVKDTARLAQRMRESTLNSNREKTQALYEALMAPDSVVAGIEDMERTLSVELNSKIEVLTGTVYADILPEAGRLAAGFFKIIIVPAKKAIAGTFVDINGFSSPIGGLPGVGGQRGIFDKHYSTPHTAYLGIDDLFNPPPDLDGYDAASSSEVNQRLCDVAEGKTFDEVCQLSEVECTVAGIADVYRRADTLIQRRPFENLLSSSDRHTRRVYNIVADDIFRRARSEIEPFILNKTEPPIALVEKYVALRDTNKRCALLRTTYETQQAIAKRNERKYGKAMGPGKDYRTLVEKKGNLNTIIGSFKTAGKDLMLWGNKAGTKVEAWEWMNGSVKSPWQVTHEMLQEYLRVTSDRFRLFGFPLGLR